MPVRRRPPAAPRNSRANKQVVSRAGLLACPARSGIASRIPAGAVLDHAVDPRTEMVAGRWQNSHRNGVRRVEDERPWSYESSQLDKFRTLLLAKRNEIASKSRSRPLSRQHAGRARFGTCHKMRRLPSPQSRHLRLECLQSIQIKRAGFGHRSATDSTTRWIAT